MKKKYNPATALRIPLTPSEQSIEDAIDESAAPQLLDEGSRLQMRIAANTALAKMRGGKRAGAGRPARASIKTSLLLSPTARAKLEKLARKAGSLSAAAEQTISAF